ncbi:MAG: hypothetical protein H7263_19350 [Candidatus Sericytochromatia bacterium]|nr:hypothetical protein [Candidatus Sericytochromatia bacterium]
MKFEFKNIDDYDFQDFLSKAKEICPHKKLDKYKRKELITFIYQKRAELLKDKLSEEQIKLLFSFDDEDNFKSIFDKDFNPQNFIMELPTTFLNQTQSGAIITIDQRKISKGGGLGKFVCDHTARIINSFKESKIFDDLIYTGFIHIPEFLKYDHLIDVLSICINGMYDKSKLDNFRVMLTGFIKFNNVKNNASSDFLFGDGISDNISSYCFKEPNEEANKRLDQIIEQIMKFERVEQIKIENIIVGRKYYFYNHRSIELILVRLPVDTNIKRVNYQDKDLSYQQFMNELADNAFGDRVQHLLWYTNKLTKPNAIVSLGVNLHLPKNIYEIETDIYGLDPKHSKGVRPRYYGHLGKGKNYDLANIYNRPLA